MIDSLDFQTSDYGLNITHSQFSIFLGNSNFELNMHDELFPNFELAHLKQVHGIDVVSSSLYNQTADGHYSQIKKIALYIKTADCLPIFLTDGSTIMALHAGWRGVLNNILQIGLNHFSDSKKIFAFIGPHIQWRSFEIEVSYAQQFLLNYPFLKGDAQFSNILDLTTAPPTTKTKLNLKHIIHQILINNGVQLNNIWMSDQDTVSTENLHSYRRDKDKSGRNWSHISLL